ncbi:CoA-binding protein [Angustibacter sp. Root456]|uniref:CoA-binding protein n=1 Tax=Angustibacter sp. Root456 TaxID=1736539 RepID=UPI0006FEB14F|nr:CoA-binding protein [Angustibacter sp. Root456]KQX69939.1 CoA-binding protein [Angustibacter sp. Root456]
MTHTNDADVVRRLLTTPATWAVVGLSANTARTAHSVSGWVAATLGMRIVPVNPRGEGVFDEPGYRSLSEIPDGEQVAVVDCYVNSSRVGEVVDEAIAQRERLGIGAVWLQLGVVDEDAAARARDAGLDVVMDTCPRIEYPRLV